MMRRRYLVPIVIGLITLVGGLQWKKLQTLQKERSQLRLQAKEIATEPAASGVARGRPDYKRVLGVSSEEVAHLHQEIAEYLDIPRNTPRGDETSILLKNWFEKAQRFSAANIREFVALSGNEASDYSILSKTVSKGGTVGALFSEAVPFQMLIFLEESRDLLGWETLFNQGFEQCLISDPSEALLLYENGIKAKKAEFQTSRIRTEVLNALARWQPDRMLELALRSEFQDDPEALNYLGSRAEAQMGNPVEAVQFLEALDRKLEKESELTFLQELRGDFVNAMSERPFGEVKEFVSLAFDRQEQLQFFAQHNAIRGYGERGEWNQWGDWFLEIEPSEWKEWAGESRQEGKHPLVTLIRNSAQRNRSFGESYLKRIPEGPLRDEATLEFALGLAGWQPERAAVYLEELPDSEGKTKLEKKIESSTGRSH